MLELREQLQHFFADYRDVLIEELLHRIGAEVKKHREVLESGGVCGLVDMDDVGKDLSQVVVNVVVQSPLHLTQEVPIQDQLIDIDQQLPADAFEQSLEGVLQIILPAERLANYGLDELFDCMKLSFEISGVEFGVGRGADLKNEMLGLEFLFGLCVYVLHPKVQQISDQGGFYYLFKQSSH